MPAYTIETTYTLPMFRHGTYIAETPEAACKAALGDGKGVDPVDDALHLARHALLDRVQVVRAALGNGVNGTG